MKTRQLLLPVAAVIGLGIAVFAVMQDRQGGRVPTPGADAENGPPTSEVQAPFASHVAGTGVVEAGTGNIAVGTPVSGIVAAVAVKWGEHIEPGATLFRLGDRDLRAQLSLATAKAQEANARLARARYELELADRLHTQHVLSDEQYRDRRFEVQIDEAALVAAKAEVERIRVEIDRRIIRAPVAGRVLQINMRPGEFAESGALATPLMVVGDDVRLRVRVDIVTPLMVVGDDVRLRVRVDIDENDAGRVKPGAPAVAVVRGRPELRTDLRFESIEPYVTPKASFTGSATERVDTRVLQVIYSFERAKLPVYVGQHLDVFIQAPPAEPPG